MDTKAIKIDYHFLDNETCIRCKKTENILDNTLDNIGELLTKAGYNLTVSKVKMDTREKALEFGFIKSPTIRVNNIDIGFEQRENSCSDCGDLCGCGENTSCRTWLFNDKEYEVPPKELITERILQVAFGNIPGQSKVAMLPVNLENYYSGKSKNKKGDCCDSTCCS